MHSFRRPEGSNERAFSKITFKEDMKKAFHLKGVFAMYVLNKLKGIKLRKTKGCIFESVEIFRVVTTIV